MTSHLSPMSRLGAAAVLAAALLVTACTESHLARRESVTSEAGNANAVNLAQTATDTMPEAARHTAHRTDGPRMVKVIERYRNPPDPNVSSDAEGGGAVERSQPEQQ